MTRHLALYLASRIFAAGGVTMLRAALIWHLYAISRDPFDLGVLGLVQLLPALFLSLPAGAVADRFERRRTVQLAQLCVVAASVAIAVLAWHSRSSPPPVLALYIVGVVVSAAAAFGNPARAALLASLVPRDAFPRAVTQASTVQALAMASGPLLAGAVIAATDVATAYAGAAVLVFASIATLTTLPAFIPERRGALSFAAVVEGLRFVAQNRVVLGAMSLDLFAVVLGGAGALLPIYANDILQVGAHGYGMLSASLEVGAVLTSLILVVLPPIRRAGSALLVAVAVYGVATIVFGLSRAFPLSLIAYGAVGMADQVSVVLRQTTIQLSTPDELRGRVSSINWIFVGASNQLSAVEAGFVAAVTSAEFAVVSGGAGVLVVVLLVALLVPQLRRFTIEGARP